MASFGERLRREREKRKVSLDDIALSTKIGTRMLHALEEEKFDQLPGGIFNKGFVRAYARHLGLDEEQTVADYLEAVNAQSAPENVEAIPEVRIVPARESEHRQSAPELPWELLAAGLLIVALALSLWSYFKREPEPSRPAISPPVSAPAANPSSTSSSAAPATSTTPPSAAVPAKPQPSEPPSATTANTFSVTLKANDDSWISITTDGKTAVADDVLTGGSEKTFQANREMVIKAGNIGALDISFNSTKVPRQGAEGEVKTLTFNQNGLVGPAAKPQFP